MSRQLSITDIESYKDFKNRCDALHKIMKSADKLYIDIYGSIEALIYAYAYALVKEKEYRQLSREEKRELHIQQIEANRQIMTFLSANDSILPLLKRSLDVDKFLEGKDE